MRFPRFYDWPIAQLVVVITTTMIMVSVIPLSLLFAWSTISILESRSEVRMVLAAKKTAAHLDDYLQDLRQQGESLFFDRPFLQQYLFAGDFSDPERKVFWRKKVFEPVRKRHHLAGTMLVTPRGEVLVQAGTLRFPRPLAGWGFFQQARAGKSALVELHTDPSGKIPLITVIMPAIDPKGRVVALAIAQDDISHLQRIIEAESSGGNGVLFDEHLVCLLNSRDSSRQGVPTYPLPPDIQEQYLNDHRFGPATVKLIGRSTNQPELRAVAVELGEHPGAARLVQTYLPSVREDGFSAMVRLRSMPWIYAVQVGQSEFHAPVRAQLKKLLGASAMIIVLLAFLSWRFARWMTDPLFAFRGVVQSWQRGEFAPRAPVYGENELGQLGLALNHMADELQAYTTRLEQLVQERTEALTHANQELQESKARVMAQFEELQKLDRLKTDFVNAVSHELRTPLTSIFGYVEFLEDELGGPLSPKQGEFVQQILLGAKRLEYLLNDLLDFARIEAGTFRLNKEESDFRAKVVEIVDSFQPQSEMAHIALTMELPEEPLVLEMDPQRIGQVLINLVSNALKFTPAGGSVRVLARVEGNELCCEVQDTGVGIAHEDMSRLFKRFSQLEAGVRSGKGTGLGLSISKALVEAHGGTIGVESEPGHGSTFWFTLPL